MYKKWKNKSICVVWSSASERNCLNPADGAKCPFLKSLWGKIVSKDLLILRPCRGVVVALVTNIKCRQSK